MRYYIRLPQDDQDRLFRCRFLDEEAYARAGRGAYEVEYVRYGELVRVRDDGDGEAMTSFNSSDFDDTILASATMLLTRCRPLSTLIPMVVP